MCIILVCPPWRYIWMLPLPCSATGFVWGGTRSRGYSLRFRHIYNLQRDTNIYFWSLKIFPVLYWAVVQIRITGNKYGDQCCTYPIMLCLIKSSLSLWKSNLEFYLRVLWNPVSQIVEFVVWLHGCYGIAWGPFKFTWLGHWTSTKMSRERLCVITSYLPVDFNN